MKWKAIKNLIAREDPIFVCLQETNIENVNKKLCRALWGDDLVEWKQVLTVNSSGGLLCLWEQGTFQVISWEGELGFLFIQVGGLGGTKSLKL